MSTPTDALQHALAALRRGDGAELALAPTHVEAHHNRGVALARLGRTAERVAAELASTHV